MEISKRPEIGNSKEPPLSWESVEKISSNKTTEDFKIIDLFSWKTHLRGKENFEERRDGDRGKKEETRKEKKRRKSVSSGKRISSTGSERRKNSNKYRTLDH